VIIPTSILAALVAALGFNATNTRTSVNEVRTTIDDRLIVVEHESQAMGTEIAVMRAQFFALQESLKRIEQKLDAAETRERERERRR
jgi:ribosomal protein S24E